MIEFGEVSSIKHESKFHMVSELWLRVNHQRKLQNLNKQEDDAFLVHPSNSQTTVLFTGDTYGT